MTAMLVSFAIYILIVIIATRNIAMAIGFMFSIRILIPSFVRTPIPPFSLNISICLTIFAIILLKRILQKKQNISNLLYPYIKNYILFLLLLLLIPRELPISTQVQGWMKTIFIDLIPAILLCFCIKNTNQIKLVLYFIYGSFFIAGIYGILTYITKTNPYILVMSIIYDSPIEFTGRILEEVRGALQGRTQGTLSHPLVWGQIVNVLLLFLLMIRTYINKYIFTSLFIILFLNAVFCGSRAILLSVIIGIIFVALENPPKKLIRYFVISLLGIIIGLNIASQNKKYQIYVNTIEATLFFWNQDKSDEIEIKGSSVELRQKQLTESFKLIENNLLTGLGQGWIDDDYQKNGLHPIMLGFESVIYRKIVETGCIGLILWFIFYFSMYRIVSLYTKKHKILCNWKIIFIPYLASLIMTDSFESFYLFISLIVLSYLYIKIYIESYQNPYK